MEYKQKKLRKDPYGNILEKGEQYEKKTGLYRYEYIGVDGRPHRFRAKTLQQLREQKKQTEHDLLEGLNTAAAKNITMNVLFDTWIENRRKIKAQTVANYKSMYDNNIRDSFLGEMPIANIKKSHIEKFYRQCEKAGLAKNTIKLLKTCLMQPLESAVDDDLIRKNPVRRVEYDGDEAVRTALTQDQQNILLTFVKDHNIYGYCYGWILFVIETGLRAGELEGLTWDDLSADGNSMQVNRQIQYRNINGETRQRIEQPKTAAGVRKIPLTEKAKDALKVQRVIDMKSGKRSTATIDGVGGFIFVNKNGKPYLTSSLNFVLKNIVNAYNDLEEATAEAEGRKPVLLPHISAHILRHTCCTNMQLKNMNPKVIQKIMGHKKLDITLNTYSHVDDGSVEQEMKRVGLLKRA